MQTHKRMARRKKRQNAYHFLAENTERLNKFKAILFDRKQIFIKEISDKIVAHIKFTPRYTEIVGYFLNINVKMCYCVFTLE